MKKPTVGECVGGPCDGVRFDPPDPEEPDDWPDTMQLECIQTGCTDVYRIRSYYPTTRKTERVYFYDADSINRDLEDR